jgi:flagellar biosynthesis/type III secretory pathway protein FliH
MTEERFKKPTEEQLYNIALANNGFVVEPLTLLNMMSMSVMIIDRLYDNGDVMIPSKQEVADSEMTYIPGEADEFLKELEEKKKSDKLKDFEDLLQSKLDELPYNKGVDDGGFNDGKQEGYEMGARWMKSVMEHMITEFYLFLYRNEKKYLKVSADTVINALAEDIGNKADYPDIDDILDGDYNTP